MFHAAIHAAIAGEKIFSGVWHVRKSTWRGTRRGGAFAADGVHPLYKSYAVEDTWALGGSRAQQQPGNGGCIRRASCHFDADHLATTVTLPGRPRKMRPYQPIIARVREQIGLRRDENPGAAVPLVDLHADGESVKHYRVSGWNPQAVAERRGQGGAVVRPYAYDGGEE